MAARYDTTIEQGATFNRTFTWETGDPAEPVDLTGWTARMTMRGAGAEDFSLTTSNGRIALGGAEGTVSVTITAADTALLKATRYSYDLELVNGAYVKRLLCGYLSCTVNFTI